MAKKRARIDTSGPSTSAHNPFRALLPADATQDVSQPELATESAEHPQVQPGKSDRLYFARRRAGRGGKTVTVISGFASASEAEKLQLLQALRKACGAGGTLRDGEIEMQGDLCQTLPAILVELGWKLRGSS